MGSGLWTRRAAVWVCAGVLAPSAAAQLRVVTWNISNYSGGRQADLETSIYDSFNGASMAPDIFLIQEMLSPGGVNSFLTIINNAPGSPGDWAAAPFNNGNDTDNAMFYRDSKVDFLGMTVVQVGAFPPAPPRDVNRYDVRLKGYASDEAIIAMYSSHMKAGSGSDDQARRLIEAQNIREDAENLPAAWSFILGGDFNIQTSSQAAYIELTGSQVNNEGRFWDPIFTPGSWNNNFSYRFVHTQDPVGAGGMDDRHDQPLTSFSLVDGVGLDYIGNPAIPYSSTTWNDPNHSYRSWGNDGTSYNTSLTTAGNSMVGQAIAQALQGVSGSGGHLPVFFDLRVPGKVEAPALIDIGTVAQGSTVDAMVPVDNAGDTALWTVDGIADLNYSMSGSAGLSAPGGSFSAAPGGGNVHLVGVDTSTTGPINETLTILSDDIDNPMVVVQIVGTVGIVCPGDYDGDLDVDLDDIATVLFSFGTLYDLNDIATVLFYFGDPC